MNGISSGILTLCTVSIVGGLACAIPMKGEYSRRIRGLTGLFLLLTLLKPLADFSSGGISFDLDEWEREGAYYASRGEELRSEQQKAIITESLNTYIETKAADYGLRLEAEVVLSDSDMGSVETVLLTGQWNGAQRADFSGYLTNELKISKENQVWIGTN